jgi:hypothetical protein
LLFVLAIALLLPMAASAEAPADLPDVTQIAVDVQNTAVTPEVTGASACATPPSTDAMVAFPTQSALELASAENLVAQECSQTTPCNTVFDCPCPTPGECACVTSPTCGQICLCYTYCFDGGDRP